MGLETATYINGLVVTNPLGTPDTVAEGDDHLRLIKSTLKNTFPNITGAVTLTDVQLNASVNLRKNFLLNGLGLVAQRGTSFTSVADDAYTLDQWVYNKVGVMVHDISQSSDVPTVAQLGVFINTSILVDCQTVDSAIASNEFAILSNYIEGIRFVGLAQSAFVVSFWVKASKVGTYCVALKNSGLDRSYIAEYTVSVAATWEKKTILVPASPSAGTWNYTTGIGLQVVFVLAAGSNFHTTANAWQTGDFLATSNQVNATDNVANDFRITRVQVYPGTTDLETVIPEPVDELMSCYRYLWRGLPAARLGGGVDAAGRTIAEAIQFPTPMRATPTLTLSTTGATLSGLSVYGIGDATTLGFSSQPVSSIAQNFASITFAAGNFLQASAEL